jgi:small subunit ribosomal protein S8
MFPLPTLKRKLPVFSLEEGFVKSYDVIEDGKQGIIRIQLKYSREKEKVITGIKRISKPGLRVLPKKMTYQKYWEVWVLPLFQHHKA